MLGYLKGGLAFVLAATGWWFILAQWAPIYASILRVEFLQPLAALIGWNDGVSFFAGSNQWGVFTASIIVIILTTGLCSLGMAGYARIQKWSLWIGLIGLAVICVLMLVSSQADFQTAFDKASSSLFNVSGAYNAIVTAGGGTNTDINPFGIGSGTFVLIPFMMFWILYPNWGATLYGEVRGSSDFKKVLRGMLAGTWVTVGLAILFLLLAAKTFGWAFFSSTGAQVYSQTPVIPIWGYPPLLASFLFDNRIFQIAVVVVFGAWFLGWSGTLFLSSTRMIFAAAFDRVLPEAAARVSDRSHVPYVALILIMVPSVVVSAVYAFWPPFVTYTLDASLVIGVMFFGTAIAATILPWWKPALYQKSPIAKYAILGIPIISIGGFLTVLVLGLDDRRMAGERDVRHRRGDARVDHLPGHPLRDRHRGVRRGLPRPPQPGRRPGPDPFGDPGRIAGLRDRGPAPASRPAQALVHAPGPRAHRCLGPSGRPVCTGRSQRRRNGARKARIGPFRRRSLHPATGMTVERPVLRRCRRWMQSS